MNTQEVQEFKKLVKRIDGDARNATEFIARINCLGYPQSLHDYDNFLNYREAFPNVIDYLEELENYKYLDLNYQKDLIKECLHCCEELILRLSALRVIIVDLCKLFESYEDKGEYERFSAYLFCLNTMKKSMDPYRQTIHNLYEKIRPLSATQDYKQIEEAICLIKEKFQGQLPPYGDRDPFDAILEQLRNFADGKNIERFYFRFYAPASKTATNLYFSVLDERIETSGTPSDGEKKSAVDKYNNWSFELFRNGETSGNFFFNEVELEKLTETGAKPSIEFPEDGYDSDADEDDDDSQEQPYLFDSPEEQEDEEDEDEEEDIISLLDDFNFRQIESAIWTIKRLYTAPLKLYHDKSIFDFISTTLDKVATGEEITNFILTLSYRNNGESMSLDFDVNNDFINVNMGGSYRSEYGSDSFTKWDFTIYRNGTTEGDFQFDEEEVRSYINLGAELSLSISDDEEWNSDEEEEEESQEEDR